jgi:hypothetical protein
MQPAYPVIGPGATDALLSTCIPVGMAAINVGPPVPSLHGQELLAGMSNWRSALIAAAVGGLILLAGFLIERAPDDGTTPPTSPDSASEAVLACPAALMPACAALAAELGTTVRSYLAGSDPGPGTVVIAPAGDIPAELETGEVAARSPIAIAVWQDREGVLKTHCGGTVDLTCLTSAFGESWADLGGLDSWGDFKLGLADATATEAGLAAWRGLASSGAPAELDAALRLTSADDAELMADLLLFGTARADAVVTTEVAIAGQLQNAPGRGGRLVVWSPDPAPWVTYVVATSGGKGTDDLIADLLDGDQQSRLGTFGLRPARGEAAGLPEGLGVPGIALPDLDEAKRAALLDAWNGLR